MIAELYDLFLKNIEMELDGYCEYNINFDYDDYSFEHIPHKLYLFYINTQEGKFEFVFSKELDIFDVREIEKYENMNEIIDEYVESDTICNVKYYAVNNCDYLERKLIQKIEDKNNLFFNFYDILILIDKNKKFDNISFYVKGDKISRPVDEEMFLKLVVYNKRIVAKAGSLEEKLYHLEDISEKEKELFYKNKKPSSGGFVAAQKSR